MKRGKFSRRVLVAAGLLVMLAPAAARPSEVFLENFGSASPQGGLVLAGGRGGGQSYTLGRLGLKSSTGSLEFWLRKSGTEEGGEDPIVSFRDKPGDDLLLVAINWGRAGAPAKIVFDRSALAEDKDRYQYDVWGSAFELPSRPGQGEWVHVVLTWNPNRAFVNGEEITSFWPIPGNTGKIDFGRATELVVGREAGEDLARNAGREPWVAAHSILGGFAVHDSAVTAAEAAGLSASRAVAERAAVASVSHDVYRVAGFSGKLVAGETVTVALTGTPGAAGTFDVVHYPDLNRQIALDWRGWGVYLEDKTFYETGEVNLRDVESYRVYASTAPFDPLAAGLDPSAGGITPVTALKVGEQSYLLENLEIDTPYYTAVVAEMRDGTLRTVVAPVVDRPLAETAPGVYSGSWTPGYRDRLPRAVVVGRLVKGTQSSSLVSTGTFAVDPALTIAVATDPSVLKADEKSASKVTVTVTDANGKPVAGHKVKFVMATTSRYTGVVGGGAFADQVGGTMRESTFGQTDIFGRLTATYVAGFAAKTAVIVARDMASNDTGAGWVRTYITATAQVELLPVENTAAMDVGYAIAVTSSDEWLTADGRSQARITARVTLNGRPAEGHPVDFTVLAGAGSIRAARDTTDANGEAQAVYTAGKKIGLVLITATDATAGISGSVSIELRSDAPAKIAIKIDPEKLPADGRSRAEVRVLVTDLNDNPNDNVEVEYAITQGGGRLQDKQGLTDGRGETANIYTAGSYPGLVSVDITVRSTAPTAEEIQKARGLAVAVTDAKFF